MSGIICVFCPFAQRYLTFCLVLCSFFDPLVIPSVSSAAAAAADGSGAGNIHHPKATESHSLSTYKAKVTGGACWRFAVWMSFVPAL